MMILLMCDIWYVAVILAEKISVLPFTKTSIRTRSEAKRFPDVGLFLVQFLS